MKSWQHLLLKLSTTAREAASICYRCWQLRNDNAGIPRMYFLPKSHKVDFPLRPITSCINGPWNGTAKVICEILGHLPTDDMNVKNSYDFKDFICDKKVPAGWGLVSLDVVSSVALVMSIITMKWQEINKHTGLDELSFLELIDMCVDNSIFSFDYVVYKQISGIPMGASYSVIFAELVMDYVVGEAVRLVQEQLGIRLE